MSVFIILPIAYCLLPIAYCLLPIAIAHCLNNFLHLFPKLAWR